MNPSQNTKDFVFRTLYSSERFFCLSADAMKAKGINVWFRHLKNNGIEVAVQTDQSDKLPMDEYGAYFGDDAEMGVSLVPRKQEEETFWDEHATGEWKVY